MKFILEKNMKRGDYVIYHRLYVVNFTYIKDDEIKTANVSIYGVFPNAKKELKEWFETNYPKYSVSNIQYLG